MATTEGKLRVTLRKSGIGRPFTQKEVLRGLGLTRLHKTVTLKDTPPIRGMVRKVVHLVEVEIL
jgi:large subunit ribosomal protein L30